MSLNQMKISIAGPMRRKTSHKRFSRKTRTTAAAAAVNGGEESCSSAVSDKLEALKSLLPSKNGEAKAADELFKETADYIVLLKTQVLVLQKLVDLYESSGGDAQNAV